MVPPRRAAGPAALGCLLQLLGGGVPTAADPASPGSREAGAARVQAWLDSWRTLSARFEQVLSSPSLPDERVESGRLRISRPDRMRWDYERPEDKLALSDGEHTWLYLPSDRQVIRGHLERLRRDSAVALLLSGSLRLEEAFRVTSHSAPADRTLLELAPRRSSESIESVLLEAEATSGRVIALTVSDPAGNRIQYRLSELIENPRLDAGLFTFRVPRGVEIQDLDASEEDGGSP